MQKRLPQDARGTELEHPSQCPHARGASSLPRPLNSAKEEARAAKVGRRSLRSHSYWAPAHHEATLGRARGQGQQGRDAAELRGHVGARLKMGRGAQGGKVP